MTNDQDISIGGLIRDWRGRRRLSQIALAADADISQRHLSFVESGRAKPSREMVIKLAETMDVPLRQRNQLLLAAGFAPSYAERSLDDDRLKAAREAIGLVLRGHDPNPALAVDRHWTLVSGNDAATDWLALASEPALLKGPVNVLRLALHPGGLAPHILNLAEWRGHLLHRLHLQVQASGDPVLANLEEELRRYPSRSGTQRPSLGSAPAIAVPLRIRLAGQALAFISTITVFGTPLDITLSELAIESFFPADAETAIYLRSKKPVALIG